MKTQLAIIIGVMIGAAAHAQQDTTRRPTPQPLQPVQPVPPVQQQPSPLLTNPNNNLTGTPNTLQGWTPVNAATISDALRQTLNSSQQYQGWQSGTIYSNQTNNMFQLRTGDVNNPKITYFDEHGRAIEPKKEN